MAPERLARADRGEYNTVRLHASIGYVTPENEHHGRGPGIRRASAAGLKRARAERIKQNRARQPDRRAGLRRPASRRGARAALERRPRADDPRRALAVARGIGVNAPTTTNTKNGAVSRRCALAPRTFL